MASCMTYCSHGGICVLPRGHEGLHDSEYCRWSDAEAITQEAADAILYDKITEQEGASAAEAFVSLFGLVAEMAAEMEDEND